MRILFVIAAAIEIFAVVLWVSGEQISVRSFILTHIAQTGSKPG